MNKYLLLFLILTGCSDYPLCDMTKGAHAFMNMEPVKCDAKGNFVKKEENDLYLCENMCNSFGQGYVEVKQYSMGTCICDNEEGRKVSLGYHLLLNNKCNIPEDYKKYE